MYDKSDAGTWYSKQCKLGIVKLRQKFSCMLSNEFCENSVGIVAVCLKRYGEL